MKVPDLPNAKVKAVEKVGFFATKTREVITNRKFCGNMSLMNAEVIDWHRF